MLCERPCRPIVPADLLHGTADHLKIKLRNAGLRHVYRVDDNAVTVIVVAIGKRERNAVYKAAKYRLTN